MMCFFFRIRLLTFIVIFFISSDIFSRAIYLFLPHTVFFIVYETTYIHCSLPYLLTINTMGLEYDKNHGLKNSCSVILV